ncbi:MAG: hypothetical protein NC084_11175 [Bacteroides sp.]|nr:hypothetical protein [Roseburia sp.]MCM1463252.1 hypothetical protein [Bacteroides sp.]
MKKTKKAIALLCSLALLAACTEAEEIEITVPTTTTARDEQPSVTTAPRETKLFADLSLDGSDTITVSGDPVGGEELTDFTYTVADLEREEPKLYQFLSDLGDPDLTEKCAEAYTLLGFFEENVLRPTAPVHGAWINAAIGDNSEEVVLYATGIRYERFYDAYLNAFTESAAKRLFTAFPNFYAYGGQLWTREIKLDEDVLETGREYALIERTEDEIVFRRATTSARPLRGDPPRTYEYDYKLVRTDEGWRVEEFPLGELTLDGVEPEGAEVAILDFPFEEAYLVPEEALYSDDPCYTKSVKIGDFLDTLDHAEEIKASFLRAYSALRLFGTDHIDDPHAVLFRNTTKTIVNDRYPDGGFYIAAGYTYESFERALLSGLTEEVVRSLLDRHPTFVSEDGALYMTGSALGGTSLNTAGWEFEPIAETEDEVRFRRVRYVEEGIGAKAWEAQTDLFEPENKADYAVEYDNFVFIKTADGWRADELFNVKADDFGLNFWF